MEHHLALTTENRVYIILVGLGQYSKAMVTDLKQLLDE
jgi:hypothetical protein